MARHRLLGPVRFTLAIALLGTLLITTAGVVSAGGAITFTPGAGGTLVTGTGASYAIPIASNTATVDVNCGGAPNSPCSVWVTKNNGPLASETLFTNITGSRTGIAYPFINDGCTNLRVYGPAHNVLFGNINVGHGALNLGGGVSGVCDGAGNGSPLLLIGGSSGSEGDSFPSGLSTAVPSVAPGGIFDSGFSGGVDETELWISQSQPGFPFTSCAAISYPNASEVLYTRNASGSISGLSLAGGGPYCFTLYQGSSHATKISSAYSITIGSYLQYVGGAANGTLNKTQGTIAYNSGNGSTNALICVLGASTGQTIVPFTFNSLGYGSAVASFQTAGAGTNIYQLRTGVGSLDGNGQATAASCGTGTVAQAFSIKT